MHTRKVAAYLNIVFSNAVDAEDAEDADDAEDCHGTEDDPSLLES